MTPKTPRKEVKSTKRTMNIQVICNYEFVFFAEIENRNVLNQFFPTFERILSEIKTENIWKKIAKEIAIYCYYHFKCISTNFPML